MNAASIEVPIRRVATVGRVPFLAALQIGRGGGKPRGAVRWRRKLAKAAFRLWHQRLRMPARGEIVIDPDGRRIAFVADFANTAYLDFAAREAGAPYEPEVTALFDALAPATGVIYDIGANWGYYVAVTLSNPRFKGAIHAFEIAPRTFASLSRLAAACGSGSRIHCHPYGLSDHSGRVRIAVGMHSALARVTASRRGSPARVEPLDALALPDPDFIKVDVEGHEAQVFRGARATISRARPVIVFESWYSGDPAEMRAPMQILSELGYRFFRLSWQAGDGSGRLSLMPLDIEARTAIATALNVLAVHPNGPRTSAALLGLEQ